MNGSEVVKRINSLIASQGLSKTQFYKECGVTSAAMSQWNTGKTMPKRSTLEVIARYLGTTASYLEAGGEEVEAAFFEGGEDLTEEERAALWEDVRNYYEFRKTQIMREKRKK